MPCCILCRTNYGKTTEAHCTLVLSEDRYAPTTRVPLCGRHDEAWRIPYAHCEMTFKLPLTRRSSPADWEWDMEVIFPLT